MRFIARSRMDVPILVAEVERLAAENEMLMRVFDGIDNQLKKIAFVSGR